MDMRRYLVMEESAAPQELNMMMTNIENNGAPWQYNQQDRLNWAKRRVISSSFLVNISSNVFDFFRKCIENN